MGNPLSAEAGVLRPSLLPGVVGMVAQNSTRDVREVRLFEMGNVFSGSTETVVEEPALALAAFGEGAVTRTVAAADALFFETKGSLEEVLARFVTPGLVWSAEDLPGWMEPGRGARVMAGGTVLAVVGELSTAEREARKLRERTVLAEVYLPALYACPLRQPSAVEPSRFQAVERDLSFLFGDGVRWADVVRAVKGLAVAEMILLEPVEIFRDAKGKSVAAGEYSLLLRMVFQSGERTLREEELTGWQEAVIGALTGIGGRHRAPEAVGSR